jgi:hypothetical protein
MCLAFLRYEPERRWPVVLLSIRDEELARPTATPGRHWLDTQPGLVGGQDLRSGGTWLAVDTDRNAVAAVFTSGGATPLDSVLRSRGDLPLIALQADGLAGLDASSYGPFTLLLADPTRATWWTSTGSGLRRQQIAAGDHSANVDGLDAAQGSPRQARWRDPLAAAAPIGFEAAVGTTDRWNGWPALVAGGLEQNTHDSLLLRSGPYGTKSVALIALGTHGVCYDVTETPTDITSWATVLPEQ